MWELVRNVKILWLHAKPTESETLGVEPSNEYFPSPGKDMSF